MLSAHTSGTASTAVSFSGVILNTSECNKMYCSANVSTFLNIDLKVGSLFCAKCYVRQCWFICTILLELSRGLASHILSFIGALQYTMLGFRFPSLHALRQYIEGSNMTNKYNY